MAAAKQASAEAKARAAIDAERRVEESKTELAQVKEQLAAVLDYKQRKEVLEEEVAKLTAELSKLRTDTAEQVLTLNGPTHQARCFSQAQLALMNFRRCSITNIQGASCFDVRAHSGSPHMQSLSAIHSACRWANAASVNQQETVVQQQ